MTRYSSLRRKKARQSPDGQPVAELGDGIDLFLSEIHESHSSNVIANRGTVLLSGIEVGQEGVLSILYRLLGKSYTGLSVLESEFGGLGVYGGFSTSHFILRERLWFRLCE